MIGFGRRLYLNDFPLIKFAGLDSFSLNFVLCPAIQFIWCGAHVLTYCLALQVVSLDSMTDSSSELILAH